jgi:hypothetical protein
MRCRSQCWQPSGKSRISRRSLLNVHDQRVVILIRRMLYRRAWAPDCVFLLRHAVAGATAQSPKLGDFSVDRYMYQNIAYTLSDCISGWRENFAQEQE